jgi:hypothetical protein
VHHKLSIPFLKALIVIVSLFAGMQQAALAQESAQSRLAGLWDEIGPSANLVQFGGDGSLKLFLKKGEIGDLRSLNGKWSVLGDGKVNVTFIQKGKSFSQTLILKFEGEEMILIDEKGEITRHRRHVGPIPERFQ